MRIYAVTIDKITNEVLSYTKGDKRGLVLTSDENTIMIKIGKADFRKIGNNRGQPYKLSLKTKRLIKFGTKQTFEEKLKPVSDIIIS